VKNSAKYVVGPAGLADIHAPVTAEQVDFAHGAEVAQAQYSRDNGTATLVLISYPTPQIAAQRMQILQSANATTDPAQPTFVIRRSGPIVALAKGDVSQSFARSLVTAVNYDANVNWTEATYLGKKDNIGNLIVAAFMLIGILLLFALGIGVAFGGLRVMMKKLFPDRVFDRPQEMEIIRLHLEE
jgi:hypothetical protein